MRQWHWLSFVVVAAVAVAVAGCGREAVGSSVEVTSAPVGYASYPQAYYDGREVYWVNDEWVYPEGGAWFAFRDEPIELRHFREGGFRGGFHEEGRGGHEAHGGFHGGGEHGGGEHGGGEHGGGEHGGGEHGGGGHGGGGHGGGGHGGGGGGGHGGGGGGHR